VSALLGGVGGFQKRIIILQFFFTKRFINPVHSLVLETLGSKLSMYVFFFCNSSLATLSLSLQDMRNILLKNHEAEVQGDWDKVFRPAALFGVNTS